MSHHRCCAGIFACLLVMTMPAVAQQPLLPDQNPRYQESMHLYLISEDSLTAQEGTTRQQTYKAYQFMEAKAERREQRRQDRRERRRAWSWGAWDSWNYWDYPGYNYGYGYPGYGYGYHGYRHHYSYAPAYQWYNLATATTLALGTYMLFR